MAKSSARDLAVIAIFAGITAALGMLPAVYVPGVSPVPITAQSFGVILAGAVLGARRGFLSQLLFLGLVAIGLPLLAGGRGGIGVFASPTAGFLVGFALVPLCIGWFTDRLGLPYRVGYGLLVNTAFGIVLMYALGLGGMLVRTHLSTRAAFVALSPYLVGDAAKVVLATLVAWGVHAAYPGLLPWRGRRRVAAQA